MTEPLNQSTQCAEEGGVFQLSEAHMRAILQTAVEGIITIDTGGTIQCFNPAAEQMFGYRAEEVIGANVNMLMPQPYHDAHRGYLERYLQTGEKRIIGIGREVVGQRKDGSQFPMDLSVAEVNVGGETTFTGIVRDMSERRRLERAIREHEEQLARFDRLDMMGEMAAGIAHEINQPLTAITAFAQASCRMLQSGQNDASVILDVLDQIARQAERAGDVIRRLRGLIKKTKTETRIIDMEDLFEETLRLVRLDRRAESTVITTELGEDLPPVEIDVIQIQQVLLNLIRNAFDAISASGCHGQIVIRAAVSEAAEMIVSIEDNGVGFTQDLADKIGHPFFTTKDSGLGMGLSISQSIIGAHGGKLWFEPPGGEGARFHFSIPTVVGVHQ
ncbi:MAG: PAS domain S-box protein [Gammaproteobacteria bacterium]|nr:PAS domain S-box protein [Gammaproteobacteria bacterium]